MIQTGEIEMIHFGEFELDIINFYVPSDKLVIQAAYSIQENAFEREVGNLKKYASVSEEKSRYIIVTYEEEEIIEKDGIKIEVIPLMKFLLMK